MTPGLWKPLCSHKQNVGESETLIQAPLSWGCPVIREPLASLCDKQCIFFRVKPLLGGLPFTCGWMCPELMQSHLKGIKHVLPISQVLESELVLATTQWVSTLYPGREDHHWLVSSAPLPTGEKRGALTELRNNYDNKPCVSTFQSISFSLPNFQTVHHSSILIKQMWAFWWYVSMVSYLSFDKFSIC